MNSFGSQNAAKLQQIASFNVDGYPFLTIQGLKRSTGKGLWKAGPNRE